MRALFETTVLNGMALKNRLVRSATFEGMAAEDGSCTQKLIELYRALARGGAGLIITGHAFVEARGRATPYQIGIHEDGMIQGLWSMTEAVHKNGGKIVIQLAHAGSFAHSDSPRFVSSPEEGGADGMSKHALKEVADSFVRAAERGQKAGFDGVQLHAAHGYLLSQFLSPHTNLRKDAYGGDLDGRSRFLIEIVKKIRANLGTHYPVLIKLNCEDFVTQGLILEESVMIGQLLASRGIGGIEMSGGLHTSRKLGPSRTGVDSEEKEAYFENQARFFKKKVKLPMLLVGGIRSFSTAQRLLEEGVTDYISMSRPFIREPELPNRWKDGEHAQSHCNSDNLCFRPALSGSGIMCVKEKRGRAIDNSSN